MVFIQDLHQQEWLNSKIAPDLIALNLQSLTGTNPYEYLFYGLPYSERRNDGRIRDKWLNRYRHIEDGGWWCSGIDLLKGGDSQWGCFKPNQPRYDSHNRKTIKYEHPPCVATELFALKVSDRIWHEIADRFSLSVEGDNFWDWVKQTPRLPILITEGAKKAAALLSSGYCAIALPGIFNGYRSDGDRSLIPQLGVLACANREFVFAFDSDKRLKTKENVANAVITTGKLLEERGCRVSVMEWDNALGKGVDDLLVNQGEERLEAIYEKRTRLAEYEQKKKEKTVYLDSARLLEFMQGEFEDRLSFDVLKSEILLDGKPIKLSNELKFWFVDTYGYRCSSSDLLDCIAYLAKQKSFNPVQQYLNACHGGKARISIDNLASRYLGTQLPLFDEMIRKWLIGAVWRAFRPGCQFDYALILQGKQGIFKSTFFRVLGGTWFDDSIKDINADDALLTLDRCWIHELAEFERVTKKKEVEDIKAFVTRRNDIFRRKYDREASEHPRRSALCGSVNKLSFLLDETGNRRFWIIPIPETIERIDIEQLAQERDAIWASAVDAFLAGELPMLSPQMEAQSAINNKQFEIGDTWESEIEAYLQDRELVSVGEILSEVFNLELSKHDRASQMRVSGILTMLGWKKGGFKTLRGKRQQVWQSCGENLSFQNIEKGCTGCTGRSLNSDRPQKGRSGTQTLDIQGIDQNSVQPVQPFPIFSNGKFSPQKCDRPKSEISSENPKTLAQQGLGDLSEQSDPILRKSDPRSIAQTYTSSLDSSVCEISSQTDKSKRKTCKYPDAPFKPGEWVRLLYVEGHENECYRVENCSHTHVKLIGFGDRESLPVWMVKRLEEVK